MKYVQNPHQEEGGTKWCALVYAVSGKFERIVVRTNFVFDTEEDARAVCEIFIQGDMKRPAERGNQDEIDRQGGDSHGGVREGGIRPSGR